ncbi:MAG: hypothetical protein IPG06_02860 [Haliea sp.]|nr:hypothetical protein [Haliea sp.]
MPLIGRHNAFKPGKSNDRTWHGSTLGEVKAWQKFWKQQPDANLRVLDAKKVEKVKHLDFIAAALKQHDGRAMLLVLQDAKSWKRRLQIRAVDRGPAQPGKTRVDYSTLPLTPALSRQECLHARLSRPSHEQHKCMNPIDIFSTGIVAAYLAAR